MPDYTVGIWAGMPKYECRFCPFDSLDETVIQGHVKKHFLERLAEDQPPEPENIEISEVDISEFTEKGNENDTSHINKNHTTRIKRSRGRRAD